MDNDLSVGIGTRIYVLVQVVPNKVAQRDPFVPAPILFSWLFLTLSSVGHARPKRSAPQSAEARSVAAVRIDA